MFVGQPRCAAAPGRPGQKAHLHQIRLTPVSYSHLLTGLGLSNGGENNIFISNVYHKTYISVNERGTRAGAATVVATTDSAALIEDVKTVYLDRPFVYMLIDCENNIPLFIGCIQNLG